MMSSSQRDEENGKLTGGQCFYTMCSKTTCCGCLPWGKFKDPKHSTYCYLITAMITCLLIAVIGPLILYTITDQQITLLMVVDSPSAPNYDLWITNAYGDGLEHVKLKYNLYYFEVQNMAETLNGHRPKLVQTGPYAFDEYYLKFDITFTDDGDTVSYNTQKYYLFNQDETGAGLAIDDPITIPYACVVGFEYLLEGIPTSYNELLDAALDTKLKDGELQLEGVMNLLYDTVENTTVRDEHTDLPSNVQQALLRKIADTNNSVQVLYNDIYSFVNQSNVGDLLLKIIMCGLPDFQSGKPLSPFWQSDPYHAWYGWQNDPLRIEVQKLLVIAQEKTNKTVPWTNSVPGGAFNWTTVEETRRRRQPDVFKTGKKNPNQVGQYVMYQNMTEMWSCVVPVLSQNKSDYEEGVQFPACAYFQHNWTDAQAMRAGYRKPFATNYANRISGTNGNGFGRPVTSGQVGLFLSEIYRSCFAAYKEDEDWNGVTVRRFGLQSKDLENATTNPANAQFYNFGPSGMENTTAAFGIPVFVSFPHFLHGDPRLVAAVEGLQPNEDVHDSVFDVEPQTGLPTLAHKRLQVNYQMVDKRLPQTDAESIVLAESICANISDVIETLSRFRIYTRNVTSLSCNLTVFTELFTCFSAPADWKMYNGEIFFPYGWVDESFQLPDSDADDIRNSLYLIDSIGEQVQFWSLIAAGILFVIILAMLYRGHLDMIARGQTVWHAFDETSPVDHYKADEGGPEAEGLLYENPTLQQTQGPAYMRNGASTPL